MTNPSTEAREAAEHVCKLYGTPWRADTLASIIQSSLDSSIAASAARVKELEAALASVTQCGPGEYRIPDMQTVYKARQVLSIKVGETKDA